MNCRAIRYIYTAMKPPQVKRKGLRRYQQRVHTMLYLMTVQGFCSAPDTTTRWDLRYPNGRAYGSQMTGSHMGPNGFRILQVWFFQDIIPTGYALNFLVKTAGHGVLNWGRNIKPMLSSKR